MTPAKYQPYNPQKSDFEARVKERTESLVARGLSRLQAESCARWEIWEEDQEEEKCAPTQKPR